MYRKYNVNMNVGNLVNLIGSSYTKDDKYIIISIEYKCDKLGLYPCKNYTLLNVKTKKKESIKIWNVSYWNYTTMSSIKHSYYTYLYSLYYTLF